METCPYCNGPYSPPPLQADVGHNKILVDGHAIPVQPSVVELFSVLLDHYPAVASVDSLICRLWGAAEPECSTNLVRIYVKRLRHALDGTGWVVQNYRGQGYQLAGGA